MMRRYAVAAAIVGMAGMTAAAAPAPTEFDAVAARSERLDLTGVPMAMNGRFRLGGDGTTGEVRRRALGRAEGWGGVTDVARYGGFGFAVSGPGVRGALGGECRYDRAERRGEIGALTISAATAPLALRCDFTRDGRAAGSMRLDAVAPRGVVPKSERAGEVGVAGATLAIRSLHRLGKRGVATDTPVGYVLSAGGATVGAVDVNGFTRRRLALPRDAAQREAALAAAIALSLFWDPGDTDD